MTIRRDDFNFLCDYIGERKRDGADKQTILKELRELRRDYWPLSVLADAMEECNISIRLKT